MEGGFHRLAWWEVLIVMDNEVPAVASPVPAMASSVFTVDALDIHMEGDDSQNVASHRHSAVNSRRKLSVSSADEECIQKDCNDDGFSVQMSRNKLKRARTAGLAASLLDVSSGSQSSRFKALQGKKGDTIFIKFLDDNVNFSNPIKMSNVLLQSVLGKYMVEDSVKMLVGGL